MTDRDARTLVSRAVVSQSAFETAASRAFQRLTEFDTMIAAALQPQRDFEAAISSALQRQVDFDAMISRALKPQIDFDAVISKALQRQVDFDAMISRALKPQVDFDAAVSKAFGPLANFEAAVSEALKRHEFLESAVNSKWMRALESLPPLADFGKAIIRAVERDERLVATMTAAAKGPGDLASIAQTALASIEVGTVARPAEENAADASPALQEPPWRMWFSQQAPAVQFIVVLIVFWILSPVWQTLVEDQVERWLGSADADEHAAALADLREMLDEHHYSRLRCVRASALNIRAEPNVDGAVIGTVQKGQAVEVVDSEGDWSRIRYQERASNSIKEGWASSGYLVQATC